MGEATKIEWATHTFNPVRGCQKVSPGCENCYAEAGSKRNPAVLGSWGPKGKRVVAAESYWRQPLAWDRAARDAIYEGFTLEQRRHDEHLASRPRVFCASLADVFEDRPEWVEPRRRLFDMIDRTPYLDWLLVTKRPENVPAMWPENPGAELLGSYASEGEDPDSVIHLHVAGRDCDGMEGDCCWGTGWLPDLPHPVPSKSYRRNVWLLASVEDQERAEKRIPGLLACRDLVPVLGLSCEPLLGPLDLECIHAYGYAWNAFTGEQWSAAHARRPLRGIDWVIVGGESGPKARPCDVGWIYRVVDQCRDAGVPAFVKQLGSCPVATPVPGYTTGLAKLKDPKGGEWDEWEPDLRVREFPQGRESPGRA